MSGAAGIASVIGGGPAGLMAAEVLATAGVRVTVFEHMPSVGRKLILAGRGGLNITHSEPLDQLLSRYSAGSDLIVNAVRRFGPTELRAWCEGLGEPTFVGSSGRVFPRSFRATPLLRAWLARLAVLGVTIENRTRWQGWAEAGAGSVDPRWLVFRRADGTRAEVHADVTVFALGGASWPRVGADGGWVDRFRNAGVRVSDLRPSNCGVQVDWTPEFAERFAGTPLKNIAISTGGTGDWIRGDAMVTAAGLEGGPVYAHSGPIRDAIAGGRACTVFIDLQPDLTPEEVLARLARRRPKDSLANTLRRSIGLSAVSRGLWREVVGTTAPRDDRELVATVKRLPLVVEHTMPIDRAISSAGGIDLSEVDESFMVRRLPGTFVAGEMLDWEAPTGGYLLQASFSTAVAAALGALDFLDVRPGTGPAPRATGPRP